MTGPLERAQRDLAAARTLIAGGFAENAISEAYFAAFRAVSEALRAVGESRSKHSGVLSAADSILVRQHGLPADTTEVLRSLFARRNTADYSDITALGSDADTAVVDAERVIEAVSAWLQARD